MVALGSGVGDRSIQLVEPMDKGMKSSHLTRDKKNTSAKGKRILKRANPDSAF